MPLIVKDFKWSQTEAFVTIQVPLHGVHQSKVDLFTCPKYIKASFERYFFEAFLWADIETQDSSCTVTPKEIVFELVKCEKVSWDKLENDAYSKSEKMELKKKWIEEEHQRFQDECKNKHSNKCELKKVAVREQISLDTKQRQLIDQIRNAEKSTALGDLNAWHKDNIIRPKIIELSSDDDDSVDQKPKPITRNKCIRKKVAHPPPSVPIPRPRKSASLQVDFTARQFPTPSRESQLEEENEWLRKQAEVRRSVGFVSEDLRPEERNPQYLKSKGEAFLKSENYLGAISAFSFGIKLTDQYPDLFIGRSEAHFKQGNFYKTAEDCSSALDLLRPAVSSNFNERITCLGRRGEALCKIGYVNEGINELQVALKLRPNDHLQKVLEEAKSILNSSGDEECNDSDLVTVKGIEIDCAQ